MPRRRWPALLAAGLLAVPLLVGLLWLGRELLRPLPPTVTPEPPRPTAPPTPLGGGSGLIAFESDRTGDLEIWVMRSDGADQRNLTRHPAQDYAPAWSPDGRRLAFLSDRADPGRSADLYLLDTGSQNVRPLTRGANLAAPLEWSPDGARLLTRQIASQALRLFVITVDGADQRVRTVDPRVADEHDLTAHWSPDGSRIAAVRARGEGLGLFILDKHLDVLSTVAAAPGTDVETCAWSPDGRRLAYTFLRRAAERAAELRVADLETGATRVIRRFAGPTGFYGLAWSPDGQRLSVAWAEPAVEGQQLAVMWTDGSGLVSLTEPPGSHPEARWSPDSRWLAYSAFLPFALTPGPTAPAGVDAYRYIFALEVAGLPGQAGALQPRLLTPLGQDAAPAWQP